MLEFDSLHIYYKFHENEGIFKQLIFLTVLDFVEKPYNQLGMKDYLKISTICNFLNL